MSKRKPNPKKPAKAKAPAKPKVAKKPPSERPPMIKVDRLEWEHHLECQKLEAEIDADQATFAEMKKAAMDVKSSISGKLVKLRRMLQNGPERLPLFDGPKAAPPQPVKSKAGKAAKGSKSKAGSATGPTAAPPTASKPADADAWRAAPIQESLHKPGNRALTMGINALLKAGVVNIGQLVDRQATGFGWTDSIPGFGEAAVTALEDALTDYLTRTRDKGVFAEAAAQALKRADDKAKESPKFPDDGNGKSIAETQADAKKTESAGKPKRSRKKSK